jgi:hypothetical protein
MALSIEQMKEELEKNRTTIYKMYRKGFLDGLKYSGYFLADISDADIELSILQKEHIHSLTQKAVRELL